MAENDTQDIDLNNEDVETTEESTTDETVDKSTPKVETDGKPKESLEDRRARLSRQLDQVNKKLGIKVEKPVSKTSETVSLSAKDQYALAQANVHIDDFDEVVDYAKYKNISIQEALKSDVLKATLATKSEFRKTAQVTNTRNTQRSVAKISDDVLLANASKGIIPEKGSEDAERLFFLRRGRK